MSKKMSHSKRMRHSKRIRNSKRMSRKSKKLLKGGANNLQSRLYALRQTNPKQTRKQMIQALQKKERSAKNHHKAQRNRLKEFVEIGKIKQAMLKKGIPIVPSIKPETEYEKIIRLMKSPSMAPYKGPFRYKPEVQHKPQSANNRAINKFEDNVSKSSTNPDFILAYSKLPNKYKSNSFAGMSVKDKNQIGALRKFFRSEYEKKMKKKLKNIYNFFPWAG
jgi:hypothetical protein